MEIQSEKSPVSHELNVRTLPAKGVTVEMEADPEQRSDLARMHGLLSVERYRAELVVRPWKKDGVQVSGRVEADITQACTVTLDPLPARIDTEVVAILVPEGSRLARIEADSGEIFVEPDGDDLPEVFEGDSVDVGALAEEFFELAIDPYPRKAGSQIGGPAEDEDAQEGGGPLYEAMKKLKGNG
ncbi:DUF177 domain-containing protein [Chelativorans sp. AA-79]|uniref:DUF177 domain-containing protein n=1 Tax=Chelativorans sp. AA-79 TaxID=3028735 RepID=UPI0023F89A2B|nr:DUF177 domain-containing protein [Chelativorans sp. AA-79]WEX07455.1 DUF177 domain-containing protein [Chelativorans sp. AA-79]